MSLVNFETAEYKGEWITFDGYDDPLRKPSWYRYFRKSVVGDDYYVVYKKSDDTLLMSNTEVEEHANRIILEKAYGDVLALGHGINFINDQILNLPAVNSVTIVEVASELFTQFPSSCTEIVGDIETVTLSQTYDVVWDDLSGKNSIGHIIQYLKPGGLYLQWRG